MAVDGNRSIGLNRKAIPSHPNYEDEISKEKMDVIRKLADPNGERAARRVLLYPSIV